MADVPEAPLEGSSDTSTEHYPLLFLTESDGSTGLQAALLTTSRSQVVNGQRLGVLAVGLADGAASATTYNIDVAVANVEYSQAIPDGTTHISFRCRDDATIRFAWESGKVAGPTAPYQTLRPGGEYSQTLLYTSGVTLYVASSTAGVTVEVEVWS